MSPSGSASSSARSTRASSTSGQRLARRGRNFVARTGRGRDRPGDTGRGAGQPPPVTANARAFKVMVRNAAFRRVELAARRDLAGLVEAELAGGLDESGWSEALAQYFAAHASIGTGPDARGRGLVQLDRAAGPLGGAPGARGSRGLARHGDHRRGGPRGLGRGGRSCMADAASRARLRSRGAHRRLAPGSAPELSGTSNAAPGPPTRYAGPRGQVAEEVGGIRPPRR